MGSTECGLLCLAFPLEVTCVSLSRSDVWLLFASPRCWLSSTARTDHGSSTQSLRLSPSFGSHRLCCSDNSYNVFGKKTHAVLLGVCAGANLPGPRSVCVCLHRAPSLPVSASVLRPFRGAGVSCVLADMQCCLSSLGPPWRECIILPFHFASS